MINSESYQDDGIPFEERDKIWTLLYEKISAAVIQKQNFAVIFDGLISEKDDSGEGYSAIITYDQYEILLQNFLMWSEGLERYEKCIEAKKILNKLEKWKEKN